MKHYFGYDSNGRLRSIESYGPRGWPDCTCDACLASPNIPSLSNPACVAPRCVSLRKSRIGGPAEVIDFILYDCECDPTVSFLRDCSCIVSWGAGHYVDVATKTFVAKPAQTITLDTDVVTQGDVLDRVAGKTTNLTVSVPGAPDNHTFEVKQGGNIDMHPEDTISAMLTSGAATIPFTAPPKGTKGWISVMAGKYTRGVSFQIRGIAEHKKN